MLIRDVVATYETEIDVASVRARIYNERKKGKKYLYDDTKEVCLCVILLIYFTYIFLTYFSNDFFDEPFLVSVSNISLKPIQRLR